MRYRGLWAVRQRASIRSSKFLSLLVCTLASAAVAQRDKPLATAYVECVRDAKGRDIASRSVRTPAFKPVRGTVYAVVTAEHSRQYSCENNTAVYIAGGGRKRRLAFQQKPERLPDGTVYDGNGVEAIRWSPSGDRMVVEVSQWKWGTDSGWNTKYIVLSPATEAATEIPVLRDIAQQFPQECVRNVISKGWRDNTHIAVEVGPAKDVDEEGLPGPTPSCVVKPTSYFFDVESGRLRQKNE
jgi:hypothetical protein